MMLKIEVENLKCGGCASGIRKALSGLPGVRNVSVDLARDEVCVEGEALREVVIEKLKQLGYPPKGENTLGSKAKSFVSCVIGRLESEN